MKQKLVLKTFAILVALLLSSTPSWGQSFSGSGSGTESDPYLIYNPNHLNDVHNFIGQSGVVFKLMQDIDLSSWLDENNPGNGWLPIGTYSQPFQGKFLGNGKKITGVFINRSTTEYVGFFGYVKNATISNLTIEGSTGKGGSMTGTLAGKLYNSTISNIQLALNVQGTDRTGGISGEIIASSSLTSVNHTGTIYCSGTQSGGITSYLKSSTISNCSHGGNVNGTDKVGGIVGLANENTSIKSSSFEGNITATDSYCGAIVGYVMAGNTTISQCVANGIVNGTSSVGGIVGYSEANELKITNCKSTGNITGTSNLGGIIGNNSSQTTVSKTYHDGKIIATGDYVGGLIGKTTNKYIITGSGHIGDIEGRSYISGGIGQSLKTETTTTYTTDKNYSQANNTIECMLIDSYAVGNITSTGNDVGGLFGYSKSYLIENVYLQINLSSYILYKDYAVSKNYSDFADGSYPYQSIYQYTINGTTYYSNKSYTNNDFLGCSFSKTTIWDPDYETFYQLRTRASGTIETDYKLSENHSMLTEASNSYHSGDITGNNYVGGIIGYGDIININTSYSSGQINANQYVGGISGQLVNTITMGSPVSSITSCVSANEVIVGTNGNTGRIYGYIGNNVTIGATGTTSANKGLATAKVTSAGSTVTLEDGPQHGTNVGASTLRLKSNYVGMGWDFDNYWKIQETECYPYKAAQCAPPKITSQLISGATSVSGQSIDGGTVILFTGNGSYMAAVSGNQWTVNVPEGLQSGDIIKVCATKTGLTQSYFTTGTVGFAGSGTEDDPYLIYTASDLANINSFSYYKIMNDIDVSEWINANSPTTGWIPVGMNSGVSMKQLDGNGKTISGLWTNSTTNYYGLISTTNDAVIKDLTINLSKNSKVGANSAILVGKSNNSTFTNIIINGNLSGGTCLGSITGLGIGNTFDNCKVTSNVTSSGVAAGGICGNSTSSSYNNCSVTGQIKGTNYTGGIAGGEAGSNTFTICFVEGTITGSNYTGGIAPYCTQSVTKCKSNSTITGSSYVGGLIGNNNATVSECFSDGSVKATATSDCYAGGLFGTNNGNVTNCYSNSTVTSGEYAAGIAGINYGSIDKCYATGNIYAEKWGAGITGYNEGNGASVTNCFAANNKIQVSEAGGIGMRMIGGYRNGASEPDYTNYALNSMVVSINNVPKTVYDDPLEGISIGIDALMSASTYVAQGWNFTDIWGIDEGNGYPFLLALAEPEFTPGDVNDDGTINVSDYVATAGYILEQDPQPFIFAAADLDGNNDITVSDLVGVAYLALTYEGAPMLAPAIAMTEAPSIAMAAEVNRLDNNIYEVAINMSNNIALSAMQMDLNLPQGMTLVDATLSDRASASHQVAFNQLNNGDYRLLSSSPACKSFKGNNGTVLTLTLKGTPSSNGGLRNIQLASPRAEGYSIDDLELNFSPTGVDYVTTSARIYSEGGNIVIVSPNDGTAQIVLPNGMSKTVNVSVGSNVYEAPAKGIVIVKMGNEIKKMRF